MGKSGWSIIGMWCGVVILSAAMTSCGSVAETTDSDQSSKPAEVRIDVDSNVKMVEINGVQCVVYDGYKAGGVSCNWEAYNGR